MLSKRGAALVRGPIDACVGSPERLSYEGAAVIDDGISRLPRVSKVVGGTGMLCARDLLAFADQHAPEDQYHALVDEAKADPEFCKRRDAAKVAYRGEHVAKAVKRGIPREKAEKAYDELIAAGSATIGERTWLPLTAEHVLYTPGGDAFTVADIKKDPLKFHDTECADPIEGLDYQSNNCAIIYTNGPRIEIYSRAHGDAFAYVAPFDETAVWRRCWHRSWRSTPPRRSSKSRTRRKRETQAERHNESGRGTEPACDQHGRRHDLRLLRLHAEAPVYFRADRRDVARGQRQRAAAEDTASEEERHAGPRQGRQAEVHHAQPCGSTSTGRSNR